MRMGREMPQKWHLMALPLNEGSPGLLIGTLFSLSSNDPYDTRPRQLAACRGDRITPPAS